VQIKVHGKRFIPFTPLHFLPEFVPHTEFKRRPEDAKWNVLNHTSFRNYAPFSLQVPTILSILLASFLQFLLQATTTADVAPVSSRPAHQAPLQDIPEINDQ
jgi:hypothetical protein